MVIGRTSKGNRAVSLLLMRGGNEIEHVSNLYAMIAGH